MAGSRAEAARRWEHADGAGVAGAGGPVASEWRCAACGGVLEDPVMHAAPRCHAAACRTCMPSRAPCPACSALVRDEEVSPVPLPMSSYLSALPIRCLVCHATMPRRAWSDHEGACPGQRCVRWCAAHGSPEDGECVAAAIAELRAQVGGALARLAALEEAVRGMQRSGVPGADEALQRAERAAQESAQRAAADREARAERERDERRLRAECEERKRRESEERERALLAERARARREAEQAETRAEAARAEAARVEAASAAGGTVARTCSRCRKEFSENADTACRYHPGDLVVIGVRSSPLHDRLYSRAVFGRRCSTILARCCAPHITRGVAITPPCDCVTSRRVGAAMCLVCAPRLPIAVAPLLSFVTNRLHAVILPSARVRYVCACARAILVAVEDAWHGMHGMDDAWHAVTAALPLSPSRLVLRV